MKESLSSPTFLPGITRQCVAILCVALIVPAAAIFPVQSQQTAKPAEQTNAKIPPDQLDSLVAPIALYPDPLLAQVLSASTYPLEIIQLQQWLQKHKDLKDQALADAVQKQDWDPSVQAMAALPDVVSRLANDIKWTTDLGNAFLAQQSDVMDAVQRMRKKAKDTGNLKTNEQQKVETKTVESKSVIVIEQANPQVVYVPTYNPVVVYGAAVYPYPPIYYPPPGYYAAGMAISFGVGVAMGAAWGGGWGWGCGWGGSYVNVNVNNRFVNNYNRTNVNNRIGAGNNNWRHNANHRGGAPYADRATAQRYGGTARGDAMSARQSNARQNQVQRGQGQLGGQAGAGNRNLAGGANAGANRNVGGGDRIGNRSVSPTSNTSSRAGAFGGASNGMSGGWASTASQRGASSMGRARGGGGGRRR